MAGGVCGRILMTAPFNWPGADPIGSDRKLDERVGMLQAIVDSELPE